MVSGSEPTLADVGVEAKALETIVPWVSGCLSTAGLTPDTWSKQRIVLEDWARPQEVAEFDPTFLNLDNEPR